jgi:transposase
LPPWSTGYQQPQRWWKAGGFETLVPDLRVLLRRAAGRNEPPTGTMVDRRTLPSSPESGGRAGYEGAKRRKGSQPHLALETLARWLTLQVTPADEPDRAPVGPLAQEVPGVTGEMVEAACVDPAYPGENAEPAAAEPGMRLEGVKLPEAKKGFVLLPRRWVLERSFAWLSQFRPLARDYERLPATLTGLHFLAFVRLMAQRFVQCMAFCL